jgi:hypothetical protein
MAEDRLVELSEERKALELRRADQQAADERASVRRRHRVYWQCVALTFVGVPVYAYSWHFTDPRQTQLAASAGFVLSYAVPFFRWLAYHISESEEFRR